MANSTPYKTTQHKSKNSIRKRLRISNCIILLTVCRNEKTHTEIKKEAKSTSGVVWYYIKSLAFLKLIETHETQYHKKIHSHALSKNPKQLTMRKFQTTELGLKVLESFNLLTSLKLLKPNCFIFITNIETFNKNNVNNITTKEE